MKNIKSVVITLLVIVSISFFLSGCSKNDSKNQTMEMNKSNEMKDSKDMNSNMNTTKDMNNTNMKMEGKEHVMINVSSMQCGTCKKNIETAVGKVDGVINVNVDKEKKVAHVNFDKSKTSISKIESAITAAGYDANDKKKDMKAYENLDDCCKLPDEQKEKK